MAGNTASTTVTSQDGLVRATVDSAGALTELEFAPTAFERTDPGTLARTVLDVVRESTDKAKVRSDTAAPPPVPPRPTPKRVRPPR
ncbi:YbaB/EbfC family nucleoid-associated protein [Prauserella marina]|uniref:YbaB/EbfC family nucleoid-associated protein n=1 Tax=Prauserella marina TaxID=530584 RepID=UPI001FE79386|nr:YbaB/EbfC family nucleoid-associated protein [Prauserella marina]